MLKLHRYCTHVLLFHRSAWDFSCMTRCGVEEINMRGYVRNFGIQIRYGIWSKIMQSPCIRVFYNKLRAHQHASSTSASPSHVKISLRSTAQCSEGNSTKQQAKAIHQSCIWVYVQGKGPLLMTALVEFGLCSVLRSQKFYVQEISFTPWFLASWQEGLFLILPLSLRCYCHFLLFF